MKQYLLILIILLGIANLMAQTPTVANLNITSGSAIKWYSAPTVGALYTGTETLVNGHMITPAKLLIE